MYTADTAYNFPITFNHRKKIKIQKQHKKSNLQHKQ